MAMTRRVKIAAGLGVAVLGALLLPSFTLNWARAAIVRSLQDSLGRRVQAGAVRLRLLPLPGFELDDVQLGEDRAFGIEPMVMAQEAVANVRWLPLLRGELEFSQIALDGASINLVRNAEGNWNLPALLRPRARGGPARGGASAAARMPYLTWSDARINFKLDQTKSRFYLDQVSGSLAREASDWRLQLQFQPARSDVSLSGAGEVRLDGRWAPAASLAQANFDLALHIRSSYLAASTALLLGHDANVRGIVSADLRVQGDGHAIAVSGAAQAESVRRADLLPRRAIITCNFAGRYLPSQDAFTLTGLGDAGWQQLQLSGTVANLFTHPAARLTLALQQFPTSGLMPLALAVKSNLPDGLRVQGSLSGRAEVGWTLGAVPRGSGSFTLRRLALAADGNRLEMPAATIAWDRQGLRLLPAPARLQGAGGRPTAMRLEAALDRRGVSFQMASPAVSADTALDLAALLGLHSPWPPGVAGVAQVQWMVLAPWSDISRPQWSGSAHWLNARFTPRGGRSLALRGLTVRQGADAQAEFSIPASADSVAGTVRWLSASAPLEFALRAPRLQAEAVWAYLRPPPSSLLARVFGDAPASPAWLAGLSGTGSVIVGDLDWHGIHTRLTMQLTAAPQQWQAQRLVLDLAEGRFTGQGSWTPGIFHISGTVPVRQPLAAATLFAATPYQGLLSGWLWGSLVLTRPDNDGGLRHIQAHGTFAVVGGELATADGEQRFVRFAGDYALQDGEATLTKVQWLAQGRRYTGAGTARFSDSGAASFDLHLHSGTQVLELQSGSSGAPGG